MSNSGFEEEDETLLKAEAEIKKLYKFRDGFLPDNLNEITSLLAQSSNDIVVLLNSFPGMGLSKFSVII